MLTILCISTYVFADTTLITGGDVEFRYIKDSYHSTSSDIQDKTQVPWWEFNYFVNKDWGDKGTGFLKVQMAQSNTGSGTVGNNTDSNGDNNGTVRLYAYGYTYKAKDWFSFTARVDGNGDVIMDSPILTDGWDYYYTFKDGTSMNMHTTAFKNRSEARMDAMILPGLDLTLAYAPSNGKTSGPEQYLAKFKYTGRNCNFYGGWTGVSNGDVRDSFVETNGKHQDDRPTYAIGGDISPSDNCKLYGEYMENEYFITKGSLRFDPFTLKVTYGNIEYNRVGNPVYMANSVDCELDYAASPRLMYIAGVAYYVDTDHDGLATATLGFNTGRLTLEAQYDDHAIILKPDSAGGDFPDRDNPVTLVDDTTRLIVKYNLDGTNTLEADVNLNESIYSIALHVNFW
jgi:hypothetical protein